VGIVKGKQRLKREQLQHLLRAASAITQQGTFVVLGSQAIIGVIDNPPGILGLSMGADMVPVDNPEMSDSIDSALGELSPFHETFGYYAQEVALETAMLPEGWDRRLNKVEDSISGAIAFCIDPVDLAAAKLVAGREKDPPFVAAMLSHGIITEAETRRRIRDLPKARLDTYGLTLQTV
jgi:Nucleotidyltransferase of unknown function (DUF6036)